MSTSFVIIVPDEKDLAKEKRLSVLTVDNAGLFTWCENAANIIADDDYWEPHLLGMRSILHTLWNAQYLPHYADVLLAVPAAIPD